MKSCVLITHAHCASSLAIHLLKEEGYEVGPPGLVDGRHPAGHYNWPVFHEPQLADNWDAYEHAVRSQKEPFAFKLQSGIIHWGVKAVDILGEPRVIVLDRKGWNDIIKRTADSQWLWDYVRALVRVVSDLERNGLPVEFWSKEELHGVKP